MAGVAMGRAGRVRPGRRIAAVVSMVVAVGLAAACTPSPAGSGSGPRAVPPQQTDPSLPTDNSEPNLWIAPKGTPRGQLAVVFNGTGTGPSVLTNVGMRLADEGFHVVILRYDSGTGTQAACPDSLASTFPECHRLFRAEVVFGAGVADPSGAAYDHPGVSVTATRSVVNRLTKMVAYLDNRYPLDGWDTFQHSVDGACVEEDPVHGACALQWSNIAAIGHSQGAGVALYLARFFDLARVVMLSGSYDVFRTGPTSLVVAPWITDGGFVTPVSRMGSMSHISDPGLPLQDAVADALGLAGPLTSVAAGRPFGGSHRLRTSATPGCPLDSAPSHNSTATNVCSTSTLHPPAWQYLATGS